MRTLTENEKKILRDRCAGLPREEALHEGGKCLCEMMVLNWTFRDIEPILFNSSAKGKNTGRNER